MKMNQRQRNAVTVGLAVISLSAFFPPWQRVMEYQERRVEMDAGYNFIGSPPAIESQFDRISIDLRRSVIQFVGIVAATGVVFLALKDKES